MSSENPPLEVTPAETTETPQAPQSKDGVPVGPTLDVYQPMRREFTLPSGVVVELREAVLADQDNLASAALQRSGTGLLSLLKACTSGLVDPGPYPFLDVRQKVDWSRLSQEDVLAGLVHLRELTFDVTELEFTVICPDPMCKEKFQKTIDLDDLPYETMSERARESIRSGENMEWEFKRSKKKIRWGVITGAESLRIAMLIMEGQKQGSKDAAIQHETFCIMVKEIEGISINDKRRVLQFLPLLDKRAFQAEIDSVQGGYDVVVKVDCIRCNRTIQEVVSVGSDFFSEDCLPSISESTSDVSSPS